MVEGILCVLTSHCTHGQFQGVQGQVSSNNLEQCTYIYIRVTGSNLLYLYSGSCYLISENKKKKIGFSYLQQHLQICLTVHNTELAVERYLSSTPEGVGHLPS